MKGTVNATLVVSLANRLRAAENFPAERRNVMAQLMAAIFAEGVQDAVANNDLELVLDDIRAALANETDPVRIVGLHRAICKLRELTTIR